MLYKPLHSFISLAVKVLRKLNRFYSGVKTDKSRHRRLCFWNFHSKRFECLPRNRVQQAIYTEQTTDLISFYHSPSRVPAFSKWMRYLFIFIIMNNVEAIKGHRPYLYRNLHNIFLSVTTTIEWKQINFSCFEKILSRPDDFSQQSLNSYFIFLSIFLLFCNFLLFSFCFLISFFLFFSFLFSFFLFIFLFLF